MGRLNTTAWIVMLFTVALCAAGVADSVADITGFAGTIIGCTLDCATHFAEDFAGVRANQVFGTDDGFLDGLFRLFGDDVRLLRDRSGMQQIHHCCMWLVA